MSLASIVFLPVPPSVTSDFQFQLFPLAKHFLLLFVFLPFSRRSSVFHLNFDFLFSHLSGDNSLDYTDCKI